MKNLFLALLVVFSVQSVFAQIVSKEAWKPEGFSKLSAFEQTIISKLSPVDQKNKIFVQLLLDTGVFKSCGLGTTLRHDKLFISVIDKKTAMRYSYVLDFNRALVNQDVFVGEAGVQIHVLVFDQAIQNLSGELFEETVFMYFFFDKEGQLVQMVIKATKNSGVGLPIISKFPESTQGAYEVNCEAR
ncbi:MAG: hypothetical protein V4596_12875 [Bdellovibrionota bacterium]